MKNKVLFDENDKADSEYKEKVVVGLTVAILLIMLGGSFLFLYL